MNRGCLNERLANFRTLVIAPVLALAMAICMGGVASAREFGNNSLHGGYGCLVTFADEFGSVSQLVFDGKGKITSGVGVNNFLGEVCTFTVDPTGSSYTVNPDGTGTLTVQVKTATAADADETSTCTLVTGASSHYAIVVESGGKRFDLSGLDPFVTGGGFTGTGDIDNLIRSGACNRQVGG
jgi:hypothetical protein